MARFASTIDNQPIYATRALNDKDGNQIDTTYAKLTDIPNVPVQDVTVDGTSVVNGQGVAEITTPTFTQVQADWTEADSSEPSYIAHKPNLATVATSGSYTDLSNTPSIPTATSDLQNDSGFITSSDIPVTDVEVDGVSVVSGGVASITLPSVPVTDVTVNGTSVVSSGTAAVTVPTATSDLTNDSGFITASDIPAQVQSDWNETDNTDPAYIQNKPTIPAAQVNADWNSSSGVSEILNKPTLAAVATSGDYSDLSNTPSIPTATSDLTNDSGYITLSDVPAQVQSDWTESDNTDPAYIANKPNLAAVATSGSYTDLSNTPTINNVPAVTSSDDDKVLKASYSGGVGSYSWETETGTTYSAGTGIDITSNTISVENPLPASTSSDVDKVLKVDSQGDAAWTSESAVNLVAGSNITITQSGNNLTISSTGGGGGGGGVNADWDETDPLEPSYIENKPTPKTLTAGANISISEGQGTLTISASVPQVPVQDVTVDGTSVVSNGVAAITTPTVDQTYDGTSTNAQSGVAVAEGLSAKADVFDVGSGLNLDTTGSLPVIKFDTPTQYSTYTDVVASKAHTSVSAQFTAIVLGPFVTLSGHYDPMAVISISSNADTLLCTLKDGFKPVMDTYVTNYPGDGSIPYGGLHIAPNGNVYVHQNGTTNSQNRYFSITYIRQM